MTAPTAPSFDTVAFHARFRPDAVACIDAATGERTTYQALDLQASRCAAALAARLPAIRGQRIATLARNGLDQVILSVALERCGAVFTPLNWRLAAAELAVILDDCQPALLLTQPEFQPAAEEAAAASTTPLADLSALAKAGTAPASLLPAGLDDPCIILYTSGTTGRAKGVVITRTNALYSSLNFAAVAGVTRHAVLLCDSPMFHTVGLIAVVRTALQQGACVVLSDRFIPATTLDRLSDPALGVTHYFVVPQMVEALIALPGFAKADLSRLTALFSGGGPLPVATVNTCLARGTLMINGYGMSEVGSAIHMPVDAGFVSTNTHTVGHQAPFIEVMLAGPNGQPVQPGDVGEIWMRGPSVSPGYWNQPEATAQSQASGGWFRSGDLARQQADGAYVIVDRLKDMYISGGENVYPAEVEAVLRQIPGVADTAVIGVPDARWGEVGCAFIQPAPGKKPTAANIRKAIGDRLARYKQPAHILVVEAIPRTASGKARKNVLREMFDQSNNAA